MLIAFMIIKCCVGPYRRKKIDNNAEEIEMQTQAELQAREFVGRESGGDRRGKKKCDDRGIGKQYERDGEKVKGGDLGVGV